MKVNDMLFEKCSTCIVQATCSCVCEDYINYINEKTCLCLKSTIKITRTQAEQFLKSVDNIEKIGDSDYIMDIDMSCFE